MIDTFIITFTIISHGSDYRTDIKALARKIKESEPVITESVMDQLEETLLKLQNKICNTTIKHYYKYKTVQTHLLPLTNIAFDKLGKRYSHIIICIRYNV